MKRWTTILLIGAVGAAGWWASQRASAASPFAQGNGDPIDPKMIIEPREIDPKMVKILPNVDPKMVRNPPAPRSPRDQTPPAPETK